MIKIFTTYKQLFFNDQIRAEIIKNIWLFIPFGAILYCLLHDWRVLLIPALLSVIIEVTQYFGRLGQCEFDDVISNFSGGAIGYYAGYYLHGVKHKLFKKSPLNI